MARASEDIVLSPDDPPAPKAEEAKEADEPPPLSPKAKSRRNSGQHHHHRRRSIVAGSPDSLNSEFLYYSAVLKTLCGTLTNDLDRRMVLPWAKKLFRPEYHSSQFREKRNGYLLYLTITLLNDEAFGVFRTPPPTGALLELNTVEGPPVVPAEWELDETWQETLANLPEDFQTLTCTVHCMQSDCDADHQLDAILDDEFRFMLYMLRPYAALLPNGYDRTRAATWMQTLCSISGGACSSMRGIRNDYLMALLGYAQSLRLPGPFAAYPPIRKLVPLAEAAKQAQRRSKPLTDPTSAHARNFLATQPMPEEGAFCYIALTGELIASSLGD